MVKIEMIVQEQEHVVFLVIKTRYDLTDGFPLLTTKKMFLRPIAEELLWFIKEILI